MAKKVTRTRKARPKYEAASMPAAAELLATAREGTVAARIIQLMLEGGRTFEALGEALGISGAYARVRARENALRKGIGFEVDRAGKVRAKLPRGVKVADVIAGERQ